MKLPLRLNMWRSINVLFLVSSLMGYAQGIPYGNNPEAGDYFDAGGVRLYFEEYGEGDPLLLLHGGVYGYIDEFEFLIPKLAENFRVICLGMRGHGKSEIGFEVNTWEQRANDAYNMLEHLEIDSAIVIGFSDGGTTSFKFASMYPEKTKKVVAMGVGYLEAEKKKKSNYTAEGLLGEYPEWFKGKLDLMPEPERWNEGLQFINELYNNDRLLESDFINIKCPVLLINGEDDSYLDVDALVAAYKLIPNADLGIIPGCGHVILYCNFPAVWENMKAFLGVEESTD